MILAEIAKSFFKNKVPENGIAVDFTMGNGYDTVFLSELVPDGLVFSFDIQEDAIKSTQKKLEENRITNVMLIRDSHDQAKGYITSPINAGMFNLGYLPGGDKNIHTMTESTLSAVKDALEMLAAGGVLTISVYPGHDEGTREGEALVEMLSLIDRHQYSILQCKMLNSPASPFIIAIERSKKG